MRCFSSSLQAWPATENEKFTLLPATVKLRTFAFIETSVADQRNCASQRGIMPREHSGTQDDILRAWGAQFLRASHAGD